MKQQQPLPDVESIRFYRIPWWDLGNPCALFHQVLQLIHERHNICKQIHLPAQSGSNRVLDAMRRGSDSLGGEDILYLSSFFESLNTAFVAKDLVWYITHSSKLISDCCLNISMDSWTCFCVSPKQNTHRISYLLNIFKIKCLLGAIFEILVF